MVTDCLKQSCWDFFVLLITAGIWKPNRLCLLEIKPDCETKVFLSPSFLFSYYKFFRENRENVNWFLKCLITVFGLQTNLVWKGLPWSGALEAAGKMAWHQHRVSAETQQQSSWPTCLKWNSAVPAVSKPRRKAVCLHCCRGLNELSLDCFENVPVNSFSFVYLSVYILVAVVLCTNTN